MFLQVVKAAADSDVLNLASSTVSALKENLIGVLNQNIGTIAIIATAVLAIIFIFRLVRRLIGR